MNNYVTTAKAKNTFGVCEDTLRRWADNGLIKTPGGHRLYDTTGYIKTQNSENKQEKQYICYCRVSSKGQKDDLQRQIKYMQEQFPNHTIVTDIGSGINFNRKGLRSIIELATKGRVNEVVVAYRDRLCRFAFELVQWILQIHQVKLVVLNQEMDSSKETELAEDLLAIINVFNCRVNGRRKYKTKEQNQQHQSHQLIYQESMD